MKVRFYVGPDGEVLSNKDYPVKGALLVIPQMDRPPISVDAVSELEITECRFINKVFKAVSVEVPDDYFTPKEGIIR